MNRQLILGQATFAFAPTHQDLSHFNKIAMRILIIRHAESIKNIQKRHGQAANDLGLTEKGKANTAILAKRILENGIKVEAIYSSEAFTSLDTAKIFSKTLNAEITILKNFKSLHYGIVCGMSNEEIIKQYPEINNQIELYNKDLLHPKEFNIPEMESTISFEQRVNQAVDLIINNSSNKSTVAVIAHASTINMMINSMSIYPASIVHHKFKRYSSPNLSITLAEIEPSTRELTKLTIDFNI